MKVFMVHEDPWHAGNPYIYTLIDGLRLLHPGCEISWGRDLFWSDEIFSFNIVHFHWPQTFMGKDPHSESDFLYHIQKMKAAGVKIVATCHDLKPHYDQFADQANSLEVVYSHCDTIFHLGEYSFDLFKSRYPKAKHLLIPHHLYDTVYKFFPSKEESLKYLHLPKNYLYILCFGTFRAEEERQLIIQLYKQLDNSKANILAPGFMDVGWHSLLVPFRRLKKLYYQYRYHIYCTGRTWKSVSDDELPYYYGAADVVFIQRLKILNSGNALMPMLFGKVVVGPDCGNVGPLLRKWGYPVFSTATIENIGDAVRDAILKKDNTQLIKNKNNQLKEYSTNTISDVLYKAYQEII